MDCKLRPKRGVDADPEFLVAVIQNVGSDQPETEWEPHKDPRPSDAANNVGEADKWSAVTRILEVSSLMGERQTLTLRPFRFDSEEALHTWNADWDYIHWFNSNLAREGQISSMGSANPVDFVQTSWVANSMRRVPAF